jgi:SAM-dependent methyltransferase
METGEREISLLLYQLKQLRLEVDRGAALDFGCGVGRLTQALARRFESTVGFDISPRMIDLARRLNKYPETVKYVLGSSSDLSTLRGRDFGVIYSNIVLQHLEPDLARRYIVELLRLLRRGGVAVFQLPSHRRPLVSGPTAMPPGAYSAEFRLLGDVPGVASPSSRLELTIEVRNRSEYTWSARTHGPIRLGNHWCAVDGSMIVQDDGRTDLPPVLEPGERCVLLLSATTPNENNALFLEIDLVHEGITWFGDRQSTVLRLPVVLGAAPPAEVSTSVTVMPSYDDGDVDRFLATSPDVKGPPADFPMHGIHRQDVVMLLNDLGATLAHVEDDGRGGPEWIGYRYYVVNDQLHPQLP